MDNGGYAGTTEIGFALLRQDNGLQTTDNGRAAAGNMDLRRLRRIHGITEIGFALLRQDNKTTS